jgi:hypothetical protein
VLDTATGNYFVTGGFFTKTQKIVLMGSFNEHEYTKLPSTTKITILWYENSKSKSGNRFIEFHNSVAETAS